MTPEGLTPPEDFLEFWQEALAEALSVPLEAHRTFSTDYELEGFVVERLRFRSVQGRWVDGWLAGPPDARHLPGFVWIPPYGRESVLPNAYGTREGFVSISLNFHGYSAFHQEKYNPSRGYFAQGAADPKTWIYRRMFQDLVVTSRILQAQVEVDEERIGAMGLSQGGGMSIWLGAWCPIIKAVCADLPFLGNVRENLSKPVHRYPIKELVDYMETLPLGRERVFNTLAYYDTAIIAQFCKVPTQVSLGLKDPACREDTVRPIFDALPGHKDLKIYNWGHDWFPDMIQNNRDWLLENLKG